MPERSAGQRAAEEWLRAVESMLGTGSWVWDRTEGRVVWSQGLYDLLGVSPSIIQPSLGFFESLVHPRDRLPMDDPESLATDGRQRNRRLRVIRPDGQLRWLQSHAQTSFNRSGEVNRVIAVVSDVTDAHEMQRRLANKAALLKVVSTLVQASLWTADEEGRLVDGIGFEPDLDQMASDRSESNWRGTVHPEDRERIASSWRGAVMRKSLYQINPRVLMRDGAYRPMHVVGLPFDSEISPEMLWGGLAGLNPRVAGAIASEPAGNLLSPAQVRACRALLGWSAENLAANAGISLSTVRRIESASPNRAHGDSIRLVVIAFQEAGLSIRRDQEGRFSLVGPG